MLAVLTLHVTRQKTGEQTAYTKNFWSNLQTLSTALLIICLFPIRQGQHCLSVFSTVFGYVSIFLVLTTLSSSSSFIYNSPTSSLFTFNSSTSYKFLVLYYIIKFTRSVTFQIPTIFI
uniref:Uncharacterized protein n=1 Tax=Cacopsylla melanoneura TaxID=428564 RepID=A0A8D8UN16_9HEMI